MKKKIAIVQSNYIPWKGYFDLINSVDEFILFDDMQYTKRDWRNRNLIKTQNGLKWLTIPVLVSGKFHQKINEAKISDVNWNKEHWKTICCNYARAEFFREYKDYFEEIYLGLKTEMLSKVNFTLLSAVCKLLEIKTKITWSSDYNLDDDRTERLVGLCKQSGASCYISGPSAKNYLEEEKLINAGIALVYFDYSDYPVYNQLFGDFEHGVTVLDLIFNTGPSAKKYLKSFKVVSV